MEQRLDVMEAAAAALGEARQAVQEATQCAANLPPEALAAKFAAQRARAALERCGESVCAPCMVSEVLEVTGKVQAIEEVIRGMMEQQSAQATVATLIQNARTCLDKEQLDEADELLAQARQALAQAEDGGGETLQQVVNMLRVTSKVWQCRWFANFRTGRNFTSSGSFQLLQSLWIYCCIERGISATKLGHSEGVIG